MNSTVFFIQDPGPDRDLSSAVRYGKIQFLLSSSDRPGTNPNSALATMRKGLVGFSSSDYLGWAGGDPMAPILAGMVLAEMGVSELQYLKWDRSRDNYGRRTSGGFYVPQKFNLRKRA